MPCPDNPGWGFFHYNATITMLLQNVIPLD